MAVVEFMNEVVNDTDVLSVVSENDILKDGYVGKIKGLATGEMDLYNFVKSSDAKGEELVMVVGADVYMDAYKSRIGYKDPRKVTYPAKRPVRAYRLRNGLRFKIDKESIPSVAKGSLVVPNTTDGYALEVDNTATSGLIFKAEAVDSHIFIGKTAVEAAVLRVVSV